jgi:hypothetical protein
MRAFCEDYSTLEQKLTERGITAKRIAILPPAPEYAQVFNTHDYEMKKSVADYKKGKKKTSTGKKIHKEG